MEKCNYEQEICTELKQIISKMDSLEMEQKKLEEDLEPIKLISKAMKDMHTKKYEEKGELHKIHYPEFIKLKLLDDKNLTQQERKLAIFLANQWDDSQHKFKKKSYTEIKKECPIDRSKLHVILKSLTEKNTIKKSRDGYHVFYTINPLVYKE